MNERTTTLVDVVRILVLIQAAIATVTLIEVGVWALSGAPLGPIVLLNLAFATGLLYLTAGIRKRSRRARKALLWIEVIVIVFASIDLILSLLLAQRPLELVPLMTRLALPFGVFRILRKPHVRSEFGIESTKEPQTMEVSA
ncbi:MAG: hypothetical protein IH941_06295 [Acidobacteria bacterium]|nr:hypothetical protein [Acidobacteriota bacterium]